MPSSSDLFSMTFKVRPFFTYMITASTLFALLMVLIQDVMILQSDDRSMLPFFMLMTAVFLFVFVFQLKRPHRITIHADRIEFRGLIGRAEFRVVDIKKIERPTAGRRTLKFHIAGETVSMPDFIEGLDDLMKTLRQRNPAIEFEGISVPE